MASSSAGSTPVRVALVEDDDILRSSMVDMVNASPELQVIGAATTLEEARALRPLNPEVFLIDLALPDGSGLELIAELAGSACKTLVISVFGDVRNVVKAIELGADGYLLKSADVAQVADAIRTVMAGGAPLSPAVAGHILSKIRNPIRAQAVPKPDAPQLTPREVQLLESLAKGLTVREVAAIHGISHHTVGDYVKTIYKKLAVNSRGEAIFEAVQSGLIRLD